MRSTLALVPSATSVFRSPVGRAARVFIVLATVAPMWRASAQAIPVPSGARVRVVARTLFRYPVVGTLVSWTNDTVTVDATSSREHPAGRQTISVTALYSLEVSRGIPPDAAEIGARKGAYAGLVIGGLGTIGLVAFVGLVYKPWCGSCTYDRGADIAGALWRGVLGTAVLTGAGAIIGALAGQDNDEWSSVFPAPRARP